MSRLELGRGTRDTILFVAGLGGIIFETVAEQIDRPYLLAVFGTMMGLPLFIRKDERDDKHGGNHADRGR